MSQQINLYDASLRARRDYAAATVVLLGGAIVAFGLLIAWIYFYIEIRALSAEAVRVEVLYQEKQDQLRLLQEELSGRQRDKRVETKMAARQYELEARESVLAALGSGQLDAKAVFSSILQALGRQRVEGVWLTHIDLDAGGRSMTLAGKTLDPDILAAYLRRLNGEPALRGTRFSVLDLARDAEEKTVEASSPATLQKPPALTFRLAAKRADEAGAGKGAR
jgi:Tfp pilus assembly protein PilN